MSDMHPPRSRASSLYGGRQVSAGGHAGRPQPPPGVHRRRRARARSPFLPLPHRWRSSCALAPPATGGFRHAVCWRRQQRTSSHAPPLLAQHQHQDDESGRLLREASPFYSYSVTAGRFSAGPEDAAAPASLQHSSSHSALSLLDSPAGSRRHHHARQYSGGLPEQYNAHLPSAATPPPRPSFASRHSAAGGAPSLGAGRGLPGRPLASGVQQPGTARQTHLVAAGAGRCAGAHPEFASSLPASGSGSPRNYSSRYSSAGAGGQAPLLQALSAARARAA
jgi:hypothetical protein